MDRRLEHGAVGQVDERAVLDERGVERREAPVGEVGELPEVALHDVGVVLQRDGERAGLTTPAGRPLVRDSVVSNVPLTITSRSGASV